MVWLTTRKYHTPPESSLNSNLGCATPCAQSRRTVPVVQHGLLLYETSLSTLLPTMPSAEMYDRNPKNRAKLCYRLLVLESHWLGCSAWWAEKVAKSHTRPNWSKICRKWSELRASARVWSSWLIAPHIQPFTSDHLGVYIKEWVPALTYHTGMFFGVLEVVGSPWIPPTNTSNLTVRLASKFGCSG